jgi:S-formylglutathione hydrolase FrmB
MKMKLLIAALMMGILSNASVDTIFIHSKSMNRGIKTIVIKPSSYKKRNLYPVVYLLHGAGGNSTNWITKVPELQSMADEQNLLLVCPDGSPNSWYFDSPVDSSFRFETHVGIEVPAYIDANYSTIPDREHRAITGLSMGGHGAMFIAFKHAETFGACGSMSGALDIRPIKKSYDIKKLLGDTISNLKYYNDWSVVNLVENNPKDSLAIIMDCGLQDFLYSMSKATHEKLVQLKVPHDYIERPGKHDWAYWRNAVRYQLVFFKEFFKRNEGK